MQNLVKFDPSKPCGKITFAPTIVGDADVHFPSKDKNGCKVDFKPTFHGKGKMIIDNVKLMNLDLGL